MPVYADCNYCEEKHLQGHLKYYRFCEKKFCSNCHLKYGLPHLFHEIEDLTDLINRIPKGYTASEMVIDEVAIPKKREPEPEPEEITEDFGIQNAQVSEPMLPQIEEVEVEVESSKKEEKKQINSINSFSYEIGRLQNIINNVENSPRIEHDYRSSIVRRCKNVIDSLNEKELEQKELLRFLPLEGVFPLKNIRLVIYNPRFNVDFKLNHMNINFYEKSFELVHDKGHNDKVLLWADHWYVKESPMTDELFDEKVTALVKESTKEEESKNLRLVITAFGYKDREYKFRKFLEIDKEHEAGLTASGYLRMHDVDFVIISKKRKDE